MRFLRFSSSSRAACAAAFALALAEPTASLATEPAPVPAASTSAEAAAGSLPLIGRVRAVTPFCRTIVSDATTLAEDQLADIRTTTEALRILAYAPFDRDIFTEHRAARALEALSARLMMSRRGEAQVHVKGLRIAARGSDGEAPRPELARFAGALDGAHSESSRVAHEISRALSVLDEDNVQVGGVFLPDYDVANEPLFAQAAAPVPFPVDAGLDHLLDNRTVQNGPLHVYARSIALTVATSLEQMLSSVDEARELFPVAFGDCADVDVPVPAATSAP
jgi:hypothetical protein